MNVKKDLGGRFCATRTIIEKPNTACRYRGLSLKPAATGRKENQAHSQLHVTWYDQVDK